MDWSDILQSQNYQVRLSVSVCCFPKVLVEWVLAQLGVGGGGDNVSTRKLLHPSSCMPPKHLAPFRRVSLPNRTWWQFRNKNQRLRRCVDGVLQVILEQCTKLSSREARTSQRRWLLKRCKVRLLSICHFLLLLYFGGVNRLFCLYVCVCDDLFVCMCVWLPFCLYVCVMTFVCLCVCNDTFVCRCVWCLYLYSSTQLVYLYSSTQPHPLFTIWKY